MVSLRTTASGLILQSFKLTAVTSDVLWRAHLGWQSCAIRRSGLEDDARHQGLAFTSSGDADTVLQDAGQAANATTHQVAGCVAAYLLTGFWQRRSGLRGRKRWEGLGASNIPSVPSETAPCHSNMEVRITYWMQSIRLAQGRQKQLICGERAYPNLLRCASGWKLIGFHLAILRGWRSRETRIGPMASPNSILNEHIGYGM